ncbi:NADAR family protein [Capnocytophaga granulosa]
MMKPTFELMTPPWIKFPAYTEFTIGWRMGAGEGYKWEFWDWYETLTPAQQQEYQALFPYPCFWHYNRWEEDERDIDDEEDYYYEGIPFWQPKGAYKYSIATFINSAKKPKFVFFWKPNAEVVNESYFSQWQPSPFCVDVEEYCCAEQYMMAEKARLFGDEEVEEEIMNTSDPKLMKALGRKVRNFDPQVWDKAKYSIVLNGNYYKFTQNKAMMDFLLSTGDKILVEASPLDTIWGIGLSKDNEKAQNIAAWRGKNLLGFALMEVRDEIRKLYQNIHLLKE